MFIAIWPLVVLLLGLVIWFVSANVKVAEAGRIAYFVGLLWTVYVLVGHNLKLG